MTVTQPLSFDLPESWSDDVPVISNTQRILRPEAPISTFGDNVWSLAAIAPLHKRDHLTCNFESIPRRFRRPVKKAVWSLINVGKPDRSVRRGGTNTKKWLAVNTVVGFVDDIRGFLKYVVAETPEVRSLRGIVSETMDAYVGSLDGKVGRESAGERYTSIRLLHDLTTDLRPSERLAAPSWVDDKVFLGDRGRGDNATQPMPDSVLTPMLLWSVSFIEQFADDILSARDVVSAYSPSARQDYAMSALQAERLIRAWQKHHGNCLPRTDSLGWGIALSYMCFCLDWATYFRGGGLKAKLGRFPEITVSDDSSCPVHTPVNGKIHGKCWQPKGLDYYRLNALQTDLQSACMLVLGLNSSMRPEELLNLRLETRQDDGIGKPVTERVEAPDGQVRHLLYGRTFKGQDGVDGTQRADGVVRTWAITELGATAVGVLARLNGRHGRLFVPIGTITTDGPAQPPTTGHAAINLRKFVKRTRCLATELELPEEYVWVCCTIR